MENVNFNVGDKVLFRYSAINRKDIPTILDLKVEKKYSSMCKQEIVTDVTLLFSDGSTYRTMREKIYKVDRRTLEVHGKYKWNVNGVPQYNGYFGDYSVIEFDGKKAVVFCDDSDAIVKVVTDWHDDIECFSWSGDSRWNSDKPLVVFDKEKGYNINAPHVNQLLCDEWLKSVESKWRYSNNLGYHMAGENKDGERVVISTNGVVHFEKFCNSEYIYEVLESVKKYSNDEVLKLWIEKDYPCARIRGLEYKGAHWGRIDKETAIEMFKTHCNFAEPFNSVEWRVLDNQVTLLFRDYCDSDYD